MRPIRLVACLFACLSACLSVCLAGTRPYEFDWANRTADDRPVLLPLVSAEGWTCRATVATVADCDGSAWGGMTLKVKGER